MKIHFFLNLPVVRKFALFQILKNSPYFFGTVSFALFSGTPRIDLSILEKRLLCDVSVPQHKNTQLAATLSEVSINAKRNRYLSRVQFVLIHR